MRVFKISLLVMLIQGFTFRVSQGQVTIKGTFQNSASFRKVYLYEYLGTLTYPVDSVPLKGNGFAFQYKKEIPRGFYMLGVNTSQSLMLILGKENVTITADLNNIKETNKIEGSVENVLFSKFLEINASQAAVMQKQESIAHQIAPLKEQNPAEYDKKVAALQASIDSSAAIRSAFYKQVVTEYPATFMSRVLNIFAFDDKLPKEKYFSAEELKDEELTRGDIIINKLSYYLNRFGSGNAEVWKNECLNLINQTPPASRSREVFLLSSIQIFVQAGAEVPDTFIESLRKEYPTKQVKNFLTTLPKKEPHEGDLAPEIDQPGLNGEKLKLSSLKGKVVLLDFWASWCGPCRMENPNVVQMYQKYKDKGFTVFSVSLDNSRDRWQQAIEKDKLSWTYHVSDLKGWQSSAAALYHVKGIPATYLIGKDGKIVAKNLRGERLESKLAELLGN